MTAIRFICLFLGLFSFSNLVNAGSGCATGTSGAISALVICAVDDGKSTVELAASGLITIAAVMAGVYLVISVLQK
jgi:hypothetical protein